MSDDIRTTREYLAIVKQLTDQGIGRDAARFMADIEMGIVTGDIIEPEDAEENDHV